MGPHQGDTDGGVRFAAPPDSVEGYGGRGVDGAAYRPPGGYLFRDNAGDTWWIIFQVSSDPASHGPNVRGDVLGCSESYEELVHVRVLAADVLRVDADAAFRQKLPSSYEEAANVAAGIPRAGTQFRREGGGA
ncbi:hypothetical protein StoSoilA2_14890 [Arthrobacter sp. StoSoilA2]|uniref:hypothetical protein n=1 Tax=unclassified Arthrobacter TaxID=235627 RepID=UPI001CC4555B|nr:MULTISPECIES: hypothetical protein [unclassified Arthrobacter]BCW35433.1 hypothetical protein StoSoilA2_14890 [Arthrobacter sp. StoSoilA2]BCW51425.1 hypothetical protein StoSoilB13_37670 [Arthrobacter sp. StoSoilB13]